MTTIRNIDKENKYTYDDYKNWKDGENWEIIDGIAYAMAPSPFREHQEVCGKIYTDFSVYLRNKSCKVYYEWDAVLSDKDIVKPDIMVVCDKDKITRKNVTGAPDLVVEVLSKSTMRRDRTTKLELYKKFGVKEYWIVDPLYYGIIVHNFTENKVTEYIFDEEEELDSEAAEIENFVPVGIFGGELKIDMKYLFSE